jgi:hypothetical protein
MRYRLGFQIHPEHFIDRHRDIVIIALGESVLVMGLGLGNDVLELPPESILATRYHTCLGYRVLDSPLHLSLRYTISTDAEEQVVESPFDGRVNGA